MTFTFSCFSAGFDDILSHIFGGGGGLFGGKEWFINLLNDKALDSNLLNLDLAFANNGEQNFALVVSQRILRESLEYEREVCIVGGSWFLTVLADKSSDF